jgi:D-alanyl-D-alanine carboxypeptidase
MLPRLAGAAALALLLPCAALAAPRTALAAKVQSLADDYLKDRAEPEHISAVSISISLPSDPANLNVVAGRVSREAGAAPVTPASIYQIGSITKSFTAATLLQLQMEGRVTMDRTLGEVLPQYPAWKDVTIRRLLNMTSGIPGYDDNPAMMEAEAKGGIGRRWSDAALVAFADPTYGHAPPPTTGWHYSNTNYILAGMIVEAITGRSFAAELDARFLGLAHGLPATAYVPTTATPDLQARMVSGYFWGRTQDLAPMRPLLGMDAKAQDMSWAGAAGALVATPEDVTRWARTLYQSSLLGERERRELLSRVSEKSGEPLASLSASEPLGFGLGVASFFKDELGGEGWYYQGESMGYRMIYGYFPREDLVIAIGLNSQPDDAENRIGKLLAATYALAREP